jgi:hypothetical protein
MKHTDIQKLLQNILLTGENEWVEFKINLNHPDKPVEIGEYISAGSRLD